MEGRASATGLSRPVRGGWPRRALGAKRSTTRASRRHAGALKEIDLPYSLADGVEQGMWSWGTGGREYSVRYQKAGSEGPAVVLIHGFGGNCDHWRKNIAPLAEAGMRVFSIDLLGYGYSDKPDPGEPNSLYNFEVWADQINAFLSQVVDSDECNAGEGAVLVGNSVGSIVALQAAADAPNAYKGVMLLNPSLRLLHITKQQPWARPFVRAFQSLLRETPVGSLFFSQVARPQAVKKILKEAYCDPSTVSDELVECVLRPGLESGATEVFLDFLSYSSGPLPEDLIPQVQCPVELVWGEEDPWEPVEMGREQFAEMRGVRNFVTLPGAGHCPMDEAPHLVNPIVKDFVADVIAECA